MIGLVLVTHGRLAGGVRAALQPAVGERPRRDILEAGERAGLGDGVVILTDMFGGTPSNLSISVMNRPNVEVVAGINLPMLVKLAKERAECPLDKAVAAAQEAGKKYITVASRVLAGK